MSSMALMISLYASKNTNPVTMAILILILSILSTTIMFKSTMTSWVSFITILTFASGMMTLFMYTASLVSNEINKTKKPKSILMLLLVALMVPHLNSTKGLETLKMFSGQTIIVIMATVLITTMLAVASHGHHPMQTLSSSF